MTRRTHHLVSALAAATLVAGSLGLAAPAHAAEPGKPGKPAKQKWSVLSATGISNIVEPGLHRTADGTLHVAITETTGSTSSLDVAHVTAAGKPAGNSLALSGWATLTEDPDFVSTPGGGMRLVFGGLRSTVTGEPYNEGYVHSVTSDAAGAAWTLAPDTTPVVKATTGYGSYGTGATTLPDGTVVAAYPLNSTITYQVGSGAPQSFDVPACCAYDMSLVQENGVVTAAWYANGSDPSTQGVFVRQLYPSLGPVVQAPGSVTGGDSLSADQAVAMVARPGGGVYVAYKMGYPTTTAVGLWRVGDATARKVPGSKAAAHVAMSATPDGRLWLAFDDAKDDVRAVRTGPGGAAFGAVQTVAPPRGTTVYGIGIDGGTGRGDVVINDGTRILHTQLLPALELTVRPRALKAGRAGELSVKVTDAGDGLKGVKVRAQGESCTTNAKGACSIDLPRQAKGSVKVTASEKGYAAAQQKVRVR